MSLAAVPIIPPSAQGYSLQANVFAAMALATTTEYTETGSSNTVHPLLLCHHFLTGMPGAGEDARELTSALGRGQLDSPLFDKVFQVPLPVPDDAAFTLEGTYTTLDLLQALHDEQQLADPYKTDIIVYDNANQGTLKITRWHQDDPRGENAHNHPWADKEGISFISYIVRGGYTEIVTAPDGSTTDKTYTAGDLNFTRYDEFHTVHNILPGTLTILMCAPRAVVAEGQQAWGYLVFEDLDGNPLTTGELVGMNDPRTRDATFLQRAAVSNPTLRFALK